MDNIDNKIRAAIAGHEAAHHPEIRVGAAAVEHVAVMEGKPVAGEWDGEENKAATLCLIDTGACVANVYVCGDGTWSYRLYDADCDCTIRAMGGFVDAAKARGAAAAWARANPDRLDWQMPPAPVEGKPADYTDAEVERMARAGCKGEGCLVADVVRSAHDMDAINAVRKHLSGDPECGGVKFRAAVLAEKAKIDAEKMPPASEPAAPCKHPSDFIEWRTAGRFCGACDAMIEASSLASAPAPRETPHTCRAGGDGDCYWTECPQEKDGGIRRQRMCPLMGARGERHPRHSEPGDKYAIPGADPRETTAAPTCPVVPGCDKLATAKGGRACADHAGMVDAAPTGTPRDHLIRCIDDSVQQEMALWWRPERRGYTINLDEAGRYTREEAESQARSRNVDFAMPLSKVLALSSRVVCADRFVELASVAAPPPPPAEPRAVEVGCTRPDGLLNIHLKSETCEMCRPAAAAAPAPAPLYRCASCGAVSTLAEMEKAPEQDEALDLCPKCNVTGCMQTVWAVTPARAPQPVSGEAAEAIAAIDAAAEQVGDCEHSDAWVPLRDGLLKARAHVERLAREVERRAIERDGETARANGAERSVGILRARVAELEAGKE